MMTQPNSLTHKDYELFRKLVYTESGINLGSDKMALVYARLSKILRQGRFKTFRDYYDHVRYDPTGEALSGLLDAITTNTTDLFREPQHFDLLRKIIHRWVADRTWRACHNALRIWSAGCSSGEEAHSIAMVADSALLDHPGMELKILATDLSVQMLSRAKLGLYESHCVSSVPLELQRRYLARVRHGDQTMLQLVPQLRTLIKFARFNLMAPSFPFQHGFDVIFCRNVMIYFDKSTQMNLINRFFDCLNDGGYLMIGHSESLSTVEHCLSYVEPAVYRKG